MGRAHFVKEVLSKQTRQLYHARLAILGGTQPTWAALSYLTVVNIA